MFPGLNREGPRNTPKVDKRKTILTHIGVKRRRMMFVVPAISPPFLCITFATLEMGKRVAESREEAQNFDHAVLLRTKRTPDPPCAQEPQLRYRDELLTVAEDTDAMVIRPFDRLDLFCRC